MGAKLIMLTDGEPSLRQRYPSLLGHMEQPGYKQDARVDFWLDKPVPYGHIDRELVELVSLLNRVEGVATLACCFGHADVQDSDDAQTWAYIDLACIDPERLLAFWSFILSFTHGQFGKVYIADDKYAGFRLELVARIYAIDKRHDLALRIEPLSMDVRRDKLVGVAFLCQLISAWIEGRQIGPQELGLVDFECEPTLTSGAPAMLAMLAAR